ncbi:hypothetical protein Ga0466249_003169 [Sporomusaceae bacterium BoRhaA]|uniref:hypothetical protein n=1 Tax=Pelorhabdus rhamnosifermentans TaxID=2772457 RepID=UPI001C06006F|nr:hypothetical protein [Pelorhabdus rhamnosifermentans]MBU2702042.1 hypothetical protein [Pelorhabdus rhamnosifermentans]
MSFHELSGRKLVLEQAIYQLNELLDGAAHPDVAEELQVLFDREQELLLEKEQKKWERQQMLGTIAALDHELDQLRNELGRRSNGKKVELFAALKKQRWYFFKSRPLWVFDRNTGLIWPNLDYVELFTGSKKSVASQIELHELAEWSVPTYQDLKTAWEDRSFPFFNEDYDVVCRKKNREETRFQTEEGFVISNDFSYNTGDYAAYALYVCNKKYETDEFLPNKHDRLFPDGFESERRLLQFFITEDLVPFFDNDYIQDIYYKFIRRRELVKQYAKLLEEQTHEKLPNIHEIISHHYCKKFYSEKAITVLEFYRQAQSWLTKVLTALEEFAEENSEGLAQIAQFSLQKEGSQVATPSASERLEKLQNLCDVSLTVLQNDIQAMWQKIDSLGEQLNQAAHSVDSLSQLAKLENQQLPSLPFLVDFVCEQVKNQLQPLCWLLEHRASVAAVIKTHQLMEKMALLFLPDGAGQQNLMNQCMEAGLAEELAVQWVQFWQQEQEMIETKILPVLDAVQSDIISDSAAVLLLEKLEQYALQVQRFYETYRLTLYQKYQAEADDQAEQQEVQEQLMKLSGPVVAAVKALSFDLKTMAAKNFLKQWIEPWLKK